jgi:fermentation-respiration switch protein FrsA (DUF1100 family)
MVLVVTSNVHRMRVDQTPGIRWWLCLISACAFAGIACASPSTIAPQSERPVAPTSTGKPFEGPASTPVPLGVGVRTFTFVDTSRATPTSTRNDTPVQPGRTIVTRVYYPAQADPNAVSAIPDAPAAGGPFPVVLFSHGLNAVPEDYRLLLLHWVHAGVVVIAPEYPLTHTGSNPMVPADLINQPGDASFVLQQVIDQSSVADAPMHGLLDADRTVAAGHSEGALTTVGLFTSCCRDPHLVGGIVLAGDKIGFERYPFVGSPVPILFIHGDADPLIPIGLDRAVYDRVAWPKGFITLIGARHIPPYIGGGTDNPAAGVVQATTTDFLHWVQDDDAGALAALQQDGNQPGVAAFDDRFN